MEKNKGWVKLWREQFGHEISERKPWCDGYAWSYLYARANYKAGIVNFRNQYIPIERGQFITSKLKLRETFGWSKRRTNSFLPSLEVRGMCTIRVTKRFIMITICNYEIYQSKEDENEPTDVYTDGPTDGPQVATNKKDKNEKKTTLSGKKTPDPRVKEFFQYWEKLFLQETGQAYVHSFGKNGKLIKDLFQVHSLELLQDTAKAFFKDERCKQRGLDIGIFKVEINRLIGMRAMDPLEQAKRELGMGKET